MSSLPIARIRLKVPTSSMEAGPVLEATAMYKAGGYTLYEGNDHLTIPGPEADPIEELK